jgi:hypothetical protein
MRGSSIHSLMTVTTVAVLIASIGTATALMPGRVLAVNKAHGHPTQKVETAATSRSTAVRSWLNLHDVVFKSLNTDLVAIKAAANNGSVTAILSSCEQLEADAKTITQLPSIPDSAIQGRWTHALQDFETGATDCINGLIENEPRLVTRSTSAVNAGIGQMNLVVNELR